jgi:hypothetical protein
LGFNEHDEPEDGFGECDEEGELLLELVEDGEGVSEDAGGEEGEPAPRETMLRPGNVYVEES